MFRWGLSCTGKGTIACVCECGKQAGLPVAWCSSGGSLAQVKGQKPESVCGVEEGMGG